MNKQIYAFIIPFVLLLILGFTPLADVPLKDFKDEINVVKSRTYTYVSKESFTVAVLNEGFENDLPAYKQFIDDSFGDDENTTIHLLNFIYYINQRSIAMIENHKVNKSSGMYDEEEFIKAVMKYGHLADLEYACAQKSFKETDINLIELYKSKSEVNDHMARFTYGLILDFPEEKKKNAVDHTISTSCNAVPVYKEQ